MNILRCQVADVYPLYTLGGLPLNLHDGAQPRWGRLHLRDLAGPKKVEGPNPRFQDDQTRAEGLHAAKQIYQHLRGSDDNSGRWALGLSFVPRDCFHSWRKFYEGFQRANIFITAQQIPRHF